MKVAEESRTLSLDLPIEHFVFDHADWSTYQKICKALWGRHVFATYYKGRLELMTTGKRHERSKTLLARMLELMALELDVPIYGYGEVTCQDKDKDLGFEADECYFIREEPSGMDDIHPLDLRRDPPPHLAIEVDITHRAIDRQAIYAEAGVRELWRFDGANLRFLRLVRGVYRHRPTSLHFPFLHSVDLERFLVRHADNNQHQLVRDFQSWVRENLA